MTTTLQTESRSTSRRVLLAGALGGISALAASAIGRPRIARGSDPNDVVLGSAANTETTTTKISNLTTGDVVFWANSSSGNGIYATSSSGYGVYGSSTSSIGVFGASNSYVGVYGLNSATNQPAAAGRSTANSTGVLGFSGGGGLPAAKANTGVYGYAAQDSSARGVWGETTSGHAIQGTATSGYAGYFDGKVYTTKWYELTEISTPATPSASRARLFIRDTAGKTQLCVKFGNGQVKVLTAET